MDLDYDETTCVFRDEVRGFLAAHTGWFPTMSYDTAEGFEQHRNWDRVLFDAGLSVITWPQRYGGRDATLLQWVVFEEEYFRAGAPGRASANGTSMLAPTLFGHGSEEQRLRILPNRSGRKPGRSRSPAATWLRYGPPPRRRPAGGCSTARRSGAAARPSVTGLSDCSVPTRTPSATAA